MLYCLLCAQEAHSTVYLFFVYLFAMRPRGAHSTIYLYYFYVFCAPIFYKATVLLKFCYLLYAPERLSVPRLSHLYLLFALCSIMLLKEINSLFT
jgi:hypothetical protein